MRKFTIEDRASLFLRRSHKVGDGRNVEGIDIVATKDGRELCIATLGHDGVLRLTNYLDERGDPELAEKMGLALHVDGCIKVEPIFFDERLTDEHVAELESAAKVLELKGKS